MTETSMTREQQYHEAFIKHADRLRWSKEVVSIPRHRHPFTHQKCIYPENTELEIEHGYRELKFSDDDVRRIPLGYLKDGTLKWHCTRRITAPSDVRAKQWVFLKYATFRFVQFDVDRHATNVDICDQVKSIEMLAKYLNAGIVWTCSPGDVFDGQHIQGLNAWIKLSRPYDAQSLKLILNRFKNQFGFASEHCADKRYRNIRVPGQIHMELIDPESMTKMISEDARHTMGEFLDAWSQCKPANNQKLLACLGRKEKHRSPLAGSRRSSTSRPRTGVGHSMPKSSVTPPRVTDTGDTYELVLNACRDALCIHGPSHPFDALCDYAETVSRGAMHRQSDSVSSGSLRAKIADQMTKFIKTFDPKGKVFRPEDTQVHDTIKDIQDTELQRALENLGACDEVALFLRRLLPVLIENRGRVANRPTRSQPNGTTLCELAGGRRQYYKMRKEILKYLRTVDEYDLGKCKLWTFTDAVFRTIRTARESQDGRAREAV